MQNDVDAQAPSLPFGAVVEQIAWWAENGFTPVDAMAALGLDTNNHAGISWPVVAMACAVWMEVNGGGC